jgi:propanol-preferring alcohol dehydrogenase
VIELGSNVNNSIKKGDMIGIPWIHETCLQCEYCLSNREEFCLKLIRSGVTVDGCFAEYVLMNAKFAVQLPQGMDPYTSAPIYCAGLTMYKALKISQVQPGEWISIVGVGGLGNILKKMIGVVLYCIFPGSIGIQYAVAMGMRVLAVVAPNDKVKYSCLMISFISLFLIGCCTTIERYGSRRRSELK